jgi:N-acetylglutamate synthase-like GNAT family acetyltransferase/predicted transcriptional regulator
MSGYRLDRILHEDEIVQLRDLLVPELKDKFPNFEVWLEKAQKKIKEGERIAIGIWKEKLIAASIIKLTTSNTAELKTFFVDTDFRDQSYGNSLYKETELQCRQAGVTKIITNTHIDNTQIVEFFISKGFLIAGKEDLYGDRRYLYIMSKSLNPKYLGDPYDWEELGEWFLRTRINAIKIKDHPKVLDRRFDRHMHIITGDYPLDILVEIKNQKVDIDNIEILHKKCNESNYHLAIFIGREFTERAKKYANDHGVILFDNEDITNILGKRPPQFREGPISGMVVPIKPDYLKRIVKGKPPFFYIKGGSDGKYLKKGHLIAFYSTEPEKKIYILGKVKSIKLGISQELWESIGNKTVFSREEFFRYTSIKQIILAIELSEIWEIPVIEGEELDLIIPKKDRSGSYMDEKTVDRIRNRK